jgi:hypothetical protein
MKLDKHGLSIMSNDLLAKRRRYEHIHLIANAGFYEED